MEQRMKEKRPVGRAMAWRCILPVIIVSIVSLLFIGISFAEGLPALFKQSETVGALQAPLSDRITVSVDFSLIHPDRDPVAAMTAVIPGRTITLLKDRIEQRGDEDYTWFGKVEDQELGTAILTVVDGFTYGRIDLMDASYSIGPDSAGYLIVKNDPAMIPPFGDDILVTPDRRGMAEAQPFGITPLADDGTVMDVLLLYTQQFATKYGGGLNARIQSLIDFANQAYANSGIGSSLRLAHSALYTDANAAEGVSIYSVLPHIRTNGVVAGLRNTYYADLVSLLRVYQDSSSCGLGYIFDPPVDNSFEGWAYNVVEVRALSECSGYPCSYCSELTLAHELGHNMGCAHDRAHSSSGGAYPYSYGYDHVAAGISSPQFATVMSYENPEFPYFSNPSITLPGYPAVYLGSNNPGTSADNAGTINNTKYTVANFRDYPDADVTPPSNGTLSATPGNGQVSLSWSGFSDSGSGLRSANTYKVVRNAGSYPAAQCTTGSQVYLGTGTSITDTGLTNGQTYYYRACAYDNSNNLSSGATAVATLQVRITVATSPSGRQIIVDSVTYTAPRTFEWTPGSTHALNVSSPQAGAAGIRYTFSTWSDGGAQSHSINRSADMTYTATFATQYQLTTGVSPAASGTVSPSCSGTCWYNSGPLNISAMPAAGYIFSSWSGDCSGGSSTTLTMNAPRSCTAVFAACASQPAKIGATTYPSLYDAYIHAGDDSIIKILGGQLTETLDLDSAGNTSVTLEGGYNCLYDTIISSSVLKGSLTIRRGSVTVENLVLIP